MKNHHGWQLPQKETLATAASYLTFVRTFLAVGFAIIAGMESSAGWLIAAIATYWIGDILDGIVARAMKQETRSGAVLDITADRLCVAVIYLTFGFMHPHLLPAIGLYLTQFMFIDGFLSLSFVFWPLLSPNYFYLIDKQIYKLNWSPAGKVINSSVFLLATIIWQSPVLSLTIALLNTVLKLYSLRRLYKVVGIPTPRQER